MKKIISTLFVIFLVGAVCYIVYSQLSARETVAPSTDDSVAGENGDSGSNQNEENKKEEGETPEADDETIDLMEDWTRNLLHYSGHLTITDVTEEAFYFTLGVIAGANVGGIEGKATISNDMASYKDDEFGCQLTFHLTKDVITIEQTDECVPYGGAGTFFDGEYEKGSENIQTDLVEQGILTEKEDTLFRSVVGEEYELYLFNISSYFDEEDKDGLGTRVVVGFIRGIAPSNGGIIMVSEEYVYAAVTDSENGVIKYHTNDARYKKALPVTIEDWVEGMSYTDVVFE